MTVFIYIALDTHRCAAGDTILEQRLVADTEFCNICFTEFMIEQGDSNIFSSIR